MPLKTKEEYIESLKKLHLDVYHFGEKIEDITSYPFFQPHIQSAAETYQHAHKPEHQELMVVTSHLTGERINRFTHIHQSTDDLINKVKMLRMLGQKTGTCFQRCVGFDGLNALYSVTYEIDEDLGTDYFTRFKRYLERIQHEDLMVAGSMTDPKGDRSKSPSQQEDPDLYLHIVGESEDGLIVRGAKAHQTGVINSHEMLVMPTVALTEKDKEYAVSFALPTDTPGVKHIFGRQTNDRRRLEKGDMDMGNARYGVVGGEALTIFEDVFVPWDRVFMCREYQYASSLVTRFASYHRQNYGGCKTGVCDVLIGATAAIAYYNGVEKASHIKDKIVEMIHLTETLYSGSIACSSEGQPTKAGSYYVNTLLANTVKQNVTRFIYEICRISHDIAGGFIATLPSEMDLKSPKIGKYIEKYFKGRAGIPTEDRIRITRLIENMTGGTALAESMHGAGSPQAQRVMMLREGNLENKIQLACHLAGIKGE